MKTVLTNSDVKTLASDLAQSIFKHVSLFDNSNPIPIYPIPRGGVAAAYALLSVSDSFVICETPEAAQIFVDDIIDSGATMERYCEQYPGIPFFALVDKTAGDMEGQWVVFPWEGGEVGGIEDNILRQLQWIEPGTYGRGGLADTPNRVAKAMKQWYSGYDADIPSILKTFEDGAENYGRPVSVINIPFYSKCEHHMADIFGTATVSYIPDGKIVGLSKLARLVEAFSRRLQVQERMTQQIADALQEHLSPKAVTVVVKARHMCMESRGICQQGHYTLTTASHGEGIDEKQMIELTAP